MTSFIAANLPSEDEEDHDYAPSLKELQEAGEASNKKVNKSKNSRKRGVADFGLEENEQVAEDAVQQKKLEKQKAKADGLWAELQQKVSGKKQKSTKMDIIDINALSLSALAKKKQKKRQEEDWMKHLGLKSKKQKKERDAKNIAEIANKALKAVKEACASAPSIHGMITIEETRRFAGKDITVQRDVEKDSKEAKKVQHGAPPKQEGLDALIASIAPTKKVTVLDKSKSDWKSFKNKDEEIQEELEVHKKSGSTYLEKKDFLSRADYAEYERERDRKLASDVRNRGRL
eukprot:jgi/Picsp_1/232/NSC_00231-R1_protein